MKINVTIRVEMQLECDSLDGIKEMSKEILSTCILPKGGIITEIQPYCISVVDAWDD